MPLNTIPKEEIIWHFPIYPNGFRTKGYPHAALLAALVIILKRRPQPVAPPVAPATNKYRGKAFTASFIAVNVISTHATENLTARLYIMKKHFAFQWHITDECDQRCKHCYIFSEDNCKQLDSMSWQRIQDTFYNCLDFCQVYGRLPYFYITGGDPILHPDFWKLLKLLKCHNIPFTILGNPFHLNDQVCIKLKEYGCEKYQLSLDGSRNTHDWFRKPGSFDITLEKIDCINNAGIKSVIMTTVSGVNIDEIPEIIDISVKAGADVFAFARYCPTSEEKDIGITPQRYRKLLEDCDKKFKEYKSAGCKTYFNKKDHLWTLYEYETGSFKIPQDSQERIIYGGCNCGNCHLTILPNGDVFACRRVLNSRVGNVFEDRLADIWICQMERYREYSKFEKCSKCELLAWCRGCPAVASGNSGNFYAPDPQCWKDIS